MLPAYFDGRLVGHLTEDDGGIAFTYAAEWLDTPSTFPISVTMPLRTETYPAETAAPWFANLLPEDRQIELVSRNLGRAATDIYGLLEAIGGETAGALSIGHPPIVAKPEYRRLSEPDLADALRRLPQRPLLAGDEGVTMSLAGAQSKLTVAIFDGQPHIPLHGAASTHILKPASDRLHATVENELLCLKLAAAVGLPAVDAAMSRAADIRYVIVERYDRTLNPPASVARGHQEDFCQALGKPASAKYEARRGPGFVDLFHVVDLHTRSPAPERLRLLDLAIFACCIGDTDRHGKNYSLILHPNGIRLAPAYDLMTSLAYDGITRNMAMTIAGQSRAEHVEKRHWERFAQATALAPAATVSRAERLAEKIAETVPRIASDLAQDGAADATALTLFADVIRAQAERVRANARRNTNEARGK